MFFIFQVLRLAWCKEITDCGLLGISNPELLDEDHVHKDGLCKCTRKQPSTDLFKKVSGLFSENVVLNRKLMYTSCEPIYRMTTLKESQRHILHQTLGTRPGVLELLVSTKTVKGFNKITHIHDFNTLNIWISLNNLILCGVIIIIGLRYVLLSTTIL